MVADVLQMHKGMVVEEVPVSSIRTKFRLRTPDEEKIREIATSISFCGLINPVSITSDGWLLAGYHRWKAFELLGYATIPAVIHDENELRGELVEVEENLTQRTQQHRSSRAHTTKRTTTNRTRHDHAVRWKINTTAKENLHQRNVQNR